MRFEDLEVWKKAARLSADIYRELKNLKDYGFKDQIIRSGFIVTIYNGLFDSSKTKPDDKRGKLQWN